MEVAVGVDPHKRSFTAAAVDPQGRELGRREFPNTLKGFTDVLNWAAQFGAQVVFGVEGSQSYGAGLARFLLQAGFEVKEIPPELAVRQRRRRRSRGKSDELDALAAARVVIEEPRLPTARRSQVLQDLKVLVDRHSQLQRQRTKEINRLHGELTVMRPGYKQITGRLTTKKALGAALSLVEGDRSVRAQVARERIEDIERLRAAVYRARKQVEEKLAETGSLLTELPGMGSINAARILGEVGGLSRIRSEAALAKLSGIAPIEASSGEIQRHRFNRGGNRQLNAAIHNVAVIQARHHERAQAYLEKKLMEGKSRREALRCLKRQLCKVIFRRLVMDMRANPALT